MDKDTESGLAMSSMAQNEIPLMESSRKERDGKIPPARHEGWNARAIKC